jgi:triosephosphate isomerase
MTRKPFVVANWKMNGNLKANDEWLCAALPQMNGTRLHCDVAVCAPSVYLPQLVIGFEHSATLVGAQNCAQYAQGAYTGEVSAAMLADIGCDLVIVGHSERRTLFGETDETVAEKTKMAFDHGVMPIVCVGETLQEREAGQTIEVVSRQLRAVLDKAGIMPLVAGAVAYEPVWAIGTGKSASAEDAQAVHQALRAVLAEVDEEAAQRTRILYGGSVKANNAPELFAQPDIDGALVGGASLKAEDFLAICHCADNL